VNLAQDLRTRAKHRGMKPWELIQKIGRLEREADNTACQLIRLATEVDELKAERNTLRDDFDRAAIAYSGALEDRRTAVEEIAHLKAELTAAQSQVANATAISELPQHISTQPVPLWQSPMAAVTNPGQARQTTWGRANDDTQPLRTVDPAA
jgi:seryl-tRNA synthetase